MKLYFINFQILPFWFFIIYLVLSDEEIIPDFKADIPLSDNFGKYSTNKLRELLEKIDKNKDLQITKDELVEWMISLSLNELDKQARSDIKFYDMDKNGKVSWIEMLRTTYGYNEEAVEKILESKDPADKDNYEFIIEDRSRFQSADVDGDGFLTHTEYKALLNPSENAKLMKLSIDKIMNGHDKNNDSQIDENEFKLYFYITLELTDTQMKEFQSIFTKYDFNKDRKLSIDELEKWYAPDIKVAANIEADTLISKTDTNNDKILTFDEILSKLNDWKISHATNFGEHIKDEL